MTTRRHRVLATLVAGALVLAACGGDDDEASSDDTAADEAGDATATTAAAGEATADDPDAGADGDACGAAAGEGGAGGAADLGGEDETAAGATVATVFDSTVAFEDKQALIEGGEAHRADHEAYVGAAEGVGGIAVEPTAVAVEGDAATVTYRVLFAGSEAYADLSMDVARSGDGWVVPTDAFCGFLASARVPCAAPGG